MSCGGLQGTDEGELQKAVKAGQVAAVKYLLLQGADPNDAGGECPPLHAAALRDSIKLVELLIDFNARIDDLDNNGQSPLHYAVMGNNQRMVQFLLDAGADLNTGVDTQLGTVMHLMPIINAPVLKALLLDAGSDLEARNAKGSTPLHQAAQYGKLADVLVLCNEGANVSARDKVGCTPLHEMVSQGHVEGVELLIARGGDPDATNDIRQTPLMLFKEMRYWKRITGETNPWHLSEPEIDRIHQALSGRSSALDRPIDYAPGHRQVIAALIVGGIGILGYYFMGGKK